MAPCGSPLTEPTHTDGLAPLLGTGPAARAAAWANSPDAYVPTLRTGPRPIIWLDAGTGDQVVAHGLVRMRAELAASGFPVSLRLRPGGHTFAVWRPAFAAALSWYTTSLEP
ncbi:hypothetical protein [Pseudofrankia sp. BMG5.37]|uniref:hypothetical protein n=1 Tax=Pseudofrankia sp. BMG5.37 TaxID=3050035 RepID=UPI0008DADDBE|nr:hypothetical protein [Pseudofrankia sp. BMG5.37]MDT3446161.1 hypothetical protein [Pseudofrankia sp. BMG5.37]OHV62285.1 hypothetical protein BCD48_39480 [Pseudofrankia sp. BMG5.36]